MSNLNKPGFLPEIHALRGIGAACIVLFHLSPVGNIRQPEIFGFIHRYFGSAVILFFMLSGFSLYLTTSSKIHGRDWMSDFYKKRYFRIAPLFYFVLLLHIARRFYYGYQINPNAVLLDIFFIFNFFPGLHESYVMAGWIIGIEAIFYIVFPVFIIFIKRSVARVFVLLPLFIWISISARVQLAEVAGLSPSYPYMNFLTHLIGFVSGIAACYLFKNVAPEWKGRLRYPSLAGFLLFFLLLVFSAKWTAFIPLNAVIVPIYALAYGLLALSMLFGAMTLLTNRLSLWLGELSYSIYLLHPLVMKSLLPVYKIIDNNAETLPTYLISAALTFAIVIPLSYVTYRLVEEKGIRYGKRFLREA